MAGRLDSHDGLTLIVALAGYDSLPILRWLMQVTPTPSFTIYGTFLVTILDADDASSDVYHYLVSCDDVTLRVSVLGIDTDRLCGPCRTLTQSTLCGSSSCVLRINGMP